MSVSVFISYRRFDSEGQAGRLYDRLVPVYSKERIFFDVDSIDEGDDFVQTIKERVAQSDIVLVMIGPNWLDARDKKGNRRLDSPRDSVRLEIEDAFAIGKAVLPILIGKSEMPGEDDLPESLRALARIDAAELTQKNFDSDAARVIRVIDAMCRKVEARREAERQAVEAARLHAEEVAREAAKQQAAEAERIRQAERQRIRAEAAEARRKAEELEALLAGDGEFGNKDVPASPAPAPDPRTPKTGELASRNFMRGHEGREESEGHSRHRQNGTPTHGDGMHLEAQSANAAQGINPIHGVGPYYTAKGVGRSRNYYLGLILPAASSLVFYSILGVLINISSLKYEEMLSVISLSNTPSAVFVGHRLVEKYHRSFIYATMAIINLSLIPVLIIIYLFRQFDLNVESTSRELVFTSFLTAFIARDIVYFMMLYLFGRNFFHKMKFLAFLLIHLVLIYVCCFALVYNFSGEFYVFVLCGNILSVALTGFTAWLMQQKHTTAKSDMENPSISNDIDA